MANVANVTLAQGPRDKYTGGITMSVETCEGELIVELGLTLAGLALLLTTGQIHCARYSTRKEEENPNAREDS